MKEATRYLRTTVGIPTTIHPPRPYRRVWWSQPGLLQLSAALPLTSTTMAVRPLVRSPLLPMTLEIPSLSPEPSLCLVYQETPPRRAALLQVRLALPRVHLLTRLDQETRELGQYQPHMPATAITDQVRPPRRRALLSQPVHQQASPALHHL
jgi:hypothetical protein